MNNNCKLESVKYTVLMSVYDKDNADFLDLSIKSVIKQTIVPNQIVIVEDGKINKKLQKVIDFYYKKYPEVFTIVKRNQNKGLGYSLNEGLRYCRNELIARMDSDDISFLDRCEKQIKKFIENPELEILGGQIAEFYESTNNIVSRRIVPLSNDEIIKFSHRRSPFNHPTVMFKKSTILKYNGYPVLSRKEDLELFVKLVNEGVKSENLNDTVLYYRVSMDNLKRRKSIRNCKEYIQVMHNFYKSKTITLCDLLYIVSGQIFFVIAPKKLLFKINNYFLRE